MRLAHSFILAAGLAIVALVAAGCSSDDSGSDEGGSPAKPSTTGATGGDGGSTSTGPGASGGGGGGIGPGGGGADSTLVTDVSCAAIGTSDTDGFFSLKSFGGALYGGLFGYGHESESMLFRYPPFEKVKPGLKGISESVCALEQYQGQLYANTESSGDIFRSADGSNWTKVHDGGAHTIGCALASFGGHLYAVNYDNGDKENGKILRSADGASWKTVWDSGGGVSRYLREIVAYDEGLYAFSVEEGSEQGYLLRSTDGVSWQESKVGARYFRAHVWKGKLWLSSTERSSNGVTGIWQYDGNDFKLVYQSDKRYVTDLMDWGGALFAATSDGWKNDEGKATLLMSTNGADWKQMCQFDELAAWAVERFAGNLYVGTWEYGKKGKLYQVSPK